MGDSARATVGASASADEEADVKSHKAKCRLAVCGNFEIDATAAKHSTCFVLGPETGTKADTCCMLERFIGAWTSDLDEATWTAGQDSRSPTD